MLFDDLDPYQVTGMRMGPALAAPAAVSQGLVAASEHAKGMTAENPLVVFGVVLAATMGLIGVTVAGRVGSAKASFSVGDA
jgi:hypothetical protein